VIPHLSQRSSPSESCFPECRRHLEASPSQPESLLSLALLALSFLTRTIFRSFLSTSLADVWLLAAIGAIGIGIGVFAFSKGSKVASTTCVLTNIPVLAYWDS
jgi:hypothetical protein